MVNRRLTKEGIEKFRKLLKQKDLSIRKFSETFRDKDTGLLPAGLSHGTVNRFFKGEAIHEERALKICKEALKICEEQVDPEEFLEPKVDKKTNDVLELADSPSRIDELVQTVRGSIRKNIQERCGKMRVLGTEKPIEVGDIYTSVNILERVTGKRRFDVEALLEGRDREIFDRFRLGSIKQKGVPGLTIVEQHSKLMILGKPGAGKTTFLKHLAILCNDNESKFQNNRVPVFIPLRELAEAEKQPTLQKYIAGRWVELGLSKDNADESVDVILRKGRALVLLDGLDEVRKKDDKRIINEINHFTKQFCNCQFVITCRIAAQEYIFEQFTDVEVADFGIEQIETFASKWFEAKKEPGKADMFIRQLENNEPVKELATTPILLTLLCLYFDDLNRFPRSRSDLYTDGLDILLRQWDATRNIERDQVYRNLSLDGKQDLLRQLAFKTFDKGDYFFKQRDIEKHIAAYINNLPNANTDPDARQLDSKIVLKSIEAHHGLLVERAKGIYSFSHLTFQEHFTARYYVDTQSLQELSSHITENRWREVFLLAVEMLNPADDLLKAMKAEVDKILAGDEVLQEFLTWVQAKSQSVDAPYKPSATRAFYFSLARALARDRDLDLDLPLALALDRDRDLDRALALDRDLGLDRDLARDCATNQEFVDSLDMLLDQLRNESKNRETFPEWWNSNRERWVNELRQAMIKHRNIGHDWQFSEEQRDKLQQYYNANKLLVECLNSANNSVTNSVREEIEDTLLLPMAEIEKERHHQ